MLPAATSSAIAAASIVELRDDREVDERQQRRLGVIDGVRER